MWMGLFVIMVVLGMTHIEVDDTAVRIVAYLFALVGAVGIAVLWDNRDKME